MRPNALQAVWERDETVINGWLGIPDSFSAEVMAHCGWDSLCIDLQHGVAGYESAVHMLQAISTTSVTPLVRVPWNDPAIIMKCLDAGAYGVVCPMVNTPAEARRFVGACRYAPLGYRSLGPIRAQIYGGADYALRANDTVVTLAMIETEEAVANLDAILSVEGLDGVYIGPADLSLSLGLPGQLDPKDSIVVEVIDRILAASKAHGRRCGIHTGSVSYAQAMRNKGFDLVTVLSDSRILSRAAEDVVAQLRGGVQASRQNTIY
ncbi:MAG: 2,4-dihydroxyhept-2-ene-1,7-dioic acid aldolase [Azospirillum brasilense]|nr:MAG: 2,4-dihydroxyhept-2-ene-1,7-dioic acid aldolase [Azospirillum brasilense]